MAVPHRCPVCGGRGNVPAGFYSQQAPGTTSGGQTSTCGETCRACMGSGILWDHGSEVFAPPPPLPPAWPGPYWAPPIWLKPIDWGGRILIQSPSYVPCGSGAVAGDVGPAGRASSVAGSAAGTVG